jgi:hypothetical protein
VGLLFRQSAQSHPPLARAVKPFKYFVAAMLLFIPLMAAQTFADQSQSANDLVRRVIANELRRQDQDHSHWMYHLESTKAGVKETKLVAGTKDGALALLIAVNDHPITDDRRKQEEQRMNSFIHDQGEQQKRKRAGEEDAAKTKQLLSMLPDAFIFTYVQGNRDTGETVELDFKPNPGFHPSTREARVFHEMEGKLTLNRKENRLAEMDGRLMHDVKFGGGILGHLDQGGTFDVRQERVGADYWEITRLKVNMKGKALFFKTISVEEDESRSHFQQIPDTLTLAQAGDLLLKEAAHH